MASSSSGNVGVLAHQLLTTAVTRLKEKEKHVSTALGEEMSGGQVALLALCGTALACCALLCVWLSSRRLMKRFDEQLLMIHGVLDETRTAAHKARVGARHGQGGGPAGPFLSAPWKAHKMAATRRHADPTGLTLVDQIRARRRAPGVLGDPEEDARLVEEDMTS